MAIKLGSKLVDALLLGPEGRQRQLQDFPVLGDVWTQFASAPGTPQDLLFIPTRERTSLHVAEIVGERAEAHNDEDRTVSVAYLHDLVVATLSLEDLVEVVFPATHWWDQIEDRWQLGGAPGEAELRQGIDAELRSLLGDQGRREIYGEEDAKRPIPPHPNGDAMQAAKLGILLGMFGAAAAANAETAGDGDTVKVFAEAVKALSPDTIVDRGVKAVLRVRRRHAALAERSHKEGENWNGVIFQVTLNRKAEAALTNSVAAIKADAARSLFSISCRQIAWAILDSGIDHRHEAFRDHAEAQKRLARMKAAAGDDAAAEPVLQSYPHRIKACFDFTRIRAILGIQTEQDIDKLVGEIALHRTVTAEKVRELLQALLADKTNRLPTDWRKLRPLIELDVGETSQLPSPEVPHGTHVAGILGADWRKPDDSRMTGVCPDILLIDCRVLGSSLGDSEFAVSAALQFLRFYNEQGAHPRVNGVNMSLAIRHNVRNYACGQTPVCLETEALASNGVVVVAAAGNRGFQQYQLADATTYEGYAASSITDPGNAEGVITVGSTHRQWPHTYGVSFFSSRGPTGDGRMKPDLLAPGEKVLSCVPGNREDRMDGTSMAAPHVSGACALLMARHEELKGQPQRIKLILCDTATDLKRERSFQGSGMVDVLRAIQSI